MLRGVRWQFLAFIVAAFVFGIALLYRLGDNVEVPSGLPAHVVTSTVTADRPFDATPTGPLPAEQPVNDAVPFSTRDDHYREALIGTVQRLNPLFVGLNPVDRDISALVFEGLTRVNAYGEPVPALAERWVISSDGLEYIMTLRNDVLWHDGTPFTAADVLYTMSLLRDPRFPGAPEISAFWRTVETDMLGDDLVRFRLSQPLGAFLDRLTIGILPEHALRGTNAAQIAAHPINLAPIGTGPYQVMRIASPDGRTPRAVELAAAPVYRQRREGQARPFALRFITFVLFDDFGAARDALAAGEVDGMASRDREERRALFELVLTNRFTLINTFEPTVGMVIYNWARESTAYFREQRVRLALEIGLDRFSAVERTLPNLALLAESPLIPGHWSYLSNLRLPAYDLSAARAMLETAAERIDRQADSTAAGSEASSGDPSALFSFTLLAPNSTSLVRLANEIATQWSQLRLDVRVEAVDIPLYEARLRAGDFDAALVEVSFSGSGDPDVYDFWHEGQYPKGANYGGVSDRRISEILERARREPYNINRINDYHRFQQEFIDRAIALPIYHPLYTYALSMAVSGVQLGYLSTPASRFENIGEWRIRRAG